MVCRDYFGISCAHILINKLLSYFRFSFLIVMISMATACSSGGGDDTGDTNGSATYYQDADSDGYGDLVSSRVATSQPAGYVLNNTDCDDSSAAINPAATEANDGIDNNCNGQIDEGFVTYYQDSDNDGYGDPANSQVATSQPAGYVSNNTDCDDGSATINPVATEANDGIDNNCDGQIDEGFVTYYQDADNDGYGDPANSQVATSQPAGYVSNNTDCDDSSAAINPSATEVNDGVDNNCNGQIDETAITSFELLDPTPGTGDQFGKSVAVLSNGNIVVTDRYDSSIASNNGAVHLYNPLTQTLIASIYGDNANDQLGVQIAALPNNNFVITSLYDDVGGVKDAGSVRLVDGTTGIQIGSALAGDVADDHLGNMGVTVLPNNNFVIASPGDDEGGIVEAGSVRLVNGDTGVQIGSAIVGDTAGAALGINGITVLSNNNYTIATSFDNHGSLVDVGTVKLVNGDTGVQIGSTIAGDSNFDGYGVFGVTALVNNNFVIVASEDDVGGLVNAGSVRLVNGDTGLQIGSTISGDAAYDQLGQAGAYALSNNNFVIASSNADEGGIVDAGTVRLVDGTTGAQIGSTIAGDTANDYLGVSATLPNSNYVISSAADDDGGLVNVGSVRLVNGATGAQIGSTITGDAVGDGLGINTIALSNNNYVAVAAGDFMSGLVGVGSVRLVNGTTGAQIGSTIAGDNTNDQLGSGGIIALANNNYVIASPLDDVGGLNGAGSVRLMDGTTGAQIGSTLAGDDESDSLGYVKLHSHSNTNIGITALSSNNFVVASEFDSEGGVVFAGSVRLVDGSTGVQVGSTIFGSASYDMREASVTESPAGDFFILSLSLADNNGRIDSGLVRLIAQ